MLLNKSEKKNNKTSTSTLCVTIWWGRAIECMNEVKKVAGHLETETGRQTQRHSKQEGRTVAKVLRDRVIPRAFQEPATRDFHSPVAFVQQRAKMGNSRFVAQPLG